MAQQTALVVDDSKLARITLQRLLEKHDFTVHAAESGLQALDVLKTLTPDVIFMDHLMPELDGFETTQKIKATPSLAHIPVIMCSGKEGVDNYEEQAIAIGACGILPKPPQPERLQEVLQIAHQARSEALARGAAPVSSVAVPVAPVAAMAAAPVWPEGFDPIQVLQRLDALEHRPIELPSFDGFTQQLRSVGESVVVLDGRLVTTEESIARLETQSTTAAEGQRTLEDQLLRLQTRLEVVETGASAPQELREEVAQALAHRDTRLAQLQADLEALRSAPPAPAAGALDEEALASRVARDVEHTLQPMLQSELATLEQRMLQSVDEAISESRKDLDTSLSEQLAARSSAPVDLSGIDLPQLSALLRDPIAELSTQAATAAVDTRIEDLGQAIRSGLEDMAGQQVDSALSRRLSKQRELLVNEVVAALEAQLEEKQGQIDALQSRLESLTAAEPSSPGGPAAAETTPPSSRGFSPLALVALVVAAIALLKSLGLF